MSILKYISCFTITAVLVSCGEKDSFDITGDPGIKFFTNNESLGNAPQNSISYAVVNIPNTAGAGWVNLSTTIPAAIRFPVMASAPVTQGVTISAELDNSLIDKYNTEHGTSYLPFPAGMLNTDALSASFAKGGTLTTDSISISTNTAGLNGLTGKSYMAPIKLSNVSNPAAGHITSNDAIQVTYIVANVEERQVKYDAPASEALGALIADRSAWTAVLTPEPIQLSGGGGILDGSTSSFSRWGVSLGQVDINMQTVHAVTGIRLRTNTSSNQTPTQVEVLVSEDGITYEFIGAPLRADMAFESGYHHILFYKPVNAKYLRLKLTYSTSTSSQNRRLAELEVYAN